MDDIHCGVVMVWSCRSSGWQNKIWEIDVRRSGDVASDVTSDFVDSGGTTTSGRQAAARRLDSTP